MTNDANAKGRRPKAQDEQLLELSDAIAVSVGCPCRDDLGQAPCSRCRLAAQGILRGNAEIEAENFYRSLEKSLKRSDDLVRQLGDATRSIKELMRENLRLKMEVDAKPKFTFTTPRPSGPTKGFEEAAAIISGASKEAYEMAKVGMNMQAQQDDGLSPGALILLAKLADLLQFPMGRVEVSLNVFSIHDGTDPWDAIRPLVARQYVAKTRTNGGPNHYTFPVMAAFIEGGRADAAASRSAPPQKAQIEDATHFIPAVE